MPLIADVDGVMCSAYDVLKEKTMYGKTSVGIVRTTVVIDKNGHIAKIFPNVKVDGHVEEVLQFVQAMAGE